MSDASAPTSFATPPRWVGAILGIAMVAAGLLVMSDVVLFTAISAILIAWTAIAIGAFEIVHAFWTRSKGGLAWNVALGILYIAFGLALLTQPVIGAMMLTYVLGLALLVSGVIRVVVGKINWQRAGGIMIASGIFGIVAGLIILTGFPRSGLWVLGLLLSVDLLSHGFGWLAHSWRS